MKSIGNLLALLFCISLAQEALAAKDTKNVTITEGQDATLPCHLPPNTKKIFKITWFKGLDKYLTKNLIVVSVSKYTSRNVDIVGQNSLFIPATTRDDAGMYQCKALYVGSAITMGSANITLYVKAAPKINRRKPAILTFYQPTNPPANLVIDCQATGYPQPEFSWSRYKRKMAKDRVSQYQNGSLVIADAHKVDGGGYTCVASNSLGTDMKNFTVIVLEPPSIIGKTNYHFNTGTTAKIKCESRGNPEPEFTWSWTDSKNVNMTLKDGEEDHRYKVTTSHGNASSISVLSIQKITTQDWMEYKCIAKNKYGEDEEDITLKGYTKPKSPRILSVTTSSTTAEVKWEFSDNGGVELESLTLQYKVSSDKRWKAIQITPPDTTTHTITDLRSDTNYNYRILATNQLGSSPPSSIYMAKTKLKEKKSGKGILEGIDTTVLIAAVAGGFLFLLFVILATLCSIRRMQKGHETATSTLGRPESQQESTEMTAFLPSQTRVPDGPSSNSLESTANPLSNSRWEFPRDRVRSTVVLGSGAFGVVMKADAQGIKGCVGSLTVAVKIVKENDSDTARKDLLAELDLLKLIDPHPNVVGLLGCCTRGDPLMLIVEFCEYGDMQSYLRHCRGIEDKYYQQIYQVPVEKLSSKDLLSFSIQVARGMAHLASMKVVHRDLAARNILIDNRKVCKVSDFGFARDIYVEDHYTRKTQGGRFPIKWMAIESLLDGVSTTSSDVWSYGVLLWEIVTLGASPYPGMNSQEVINFLRDGYRMDKPKHCSQELYCIMLDCWQVTPQGRPIFLDMSRQLTKMLADEREFINMRSYDDHLYVNFDSATSQSGHGSSSGSQAKGMPLEFRPHTSSSRSS
ncbi:fibroblast growth factor receptor 4-like isoform X2 [Actinia tenebrosa]|uniref:receptor protein-tyrosine kinase n=1 Tax=Actinia tenebrosa TaxID=6105 RepID=A0A6P8IGJ6_ACTTE|nr:fibroblast growth factor receptor 4-like isoform X2 [Actinia tenebrosa]